MDVYDARPNASRPLVSILVVVYRDRDALRQILDNLAAFRGPEVEVVIVDGGSDDGSLDLLRERSPSIDFWLSEPDNGIYQAMNKAIAHARGEFVLHINAGDRLLAIPMEALRCSDAAAVAFAVDYDNGERFAPQFDWKLEYYNTLPHQGLFYRRLPHLVYDTAFRVFADFDLNQRMRLAGLRIETHPDVVALHALGGVSTHDTHRPEFVAILRRNYGLSRVLLFELSSYRFGRRILRGFDVGPAAVLRSARRQLLEKLRLRPHP